MLLGIPQSGSPPPTYTIDYVLELLHYQISFLPSLPLPSLSLSLPLPSSLHASLSLSLLLLCVCVRACVCVRVDVVTMLFGIPKQCSCFRQAMGNYVVHASFEEINCIMGWLLRTVGDREREEEKSHKQTVSPWAMPTHSSDLFSFSCGHSN